MREIKFRGKRVDDEKWVYGSLHIGNACWITQKSQDESKGLQPFRPKQVEPATVGQYTGLHDKNGVEIYEGDIVKVHDSYKPRHVFTGIVDFDNASFLIDDSCVKHYRWMDYECEVIGNVFENPELLEVEG